MRITAIAACCAALALAAAPIVRHRLGWADAQTYPAHGIDPNIVPPLVIGMNLAGAVSYGSEDAFADPIKSHVSLGFSANYTEVALKDQVKRDDSGHPIDVPAGTDLVAYLHDGTAPLVPGPYRCTVSPGWRVSPHWNVFAPGASQLAQSGTRFTVTVPPHFNTSKIGVDLIAEKNGANLTTLACRYPDVSPDAVFRPDFLNEMRPFRVIRFMQWTLTNNEPHQSWASRPTPQSFDQTSQGVAVEHMVELANTLHSDPWFTLPWDADPDYYRNFATYVRDHLDPGLKAYVELSNEVWNESFSQAKDATAKGMLRYPGVGDVKANDYYYADRVRDLMTIWSDVFKGQETRIVRVMASQLWAERGANRLGHKESWKYVDALAVAPYWGDAFNVPGTGKPWADALFAKAPASIDEVLVQGHQNKVIAAKFGLPLITYEGGPNFNAFEPQMTADLKAFEADPRFYTLYQTFLRRWQKEIGGLLMLFDGTGPTFYGHLDHTGQPLSEATKMRAVVDFIHQLPPAPPSPGAAKPAS